MYSVYQTNLIYCINLQHRQDRKQHTQTEFMKIDIAPEMVIYPRLVKDPRGGVYGCYESHLKIWNDFYYNYPDKPYCLIFEDDFVAQPKAKELMEKAQEFINHNYRQVDILNLHDFDVPVDNPINNKTFNNGYGFLMHAYFITRPYLENILKKNQNKFPSANGYHIDFLLNTYKKNLLYSEKIFYTTQPCFIQLVDKSDNYLNKLDELMREDVNERTYRGIKFSRFVKKYKLLTDNGIKNVYMLLGEIINIF
jgi:GR25 family glycosyltransferase involved in LPS biosynthesis